MKLKASNTALLVFSLTAQAEAERKPIFGKAKNFASLGLYHQLIHKTQRLAKESGLDVFWFDEKNQIGETFGEKYTNSFQHIFNQGYHKVISIGNDTPDLNAEILTEAIQQLKHQDLILGPSRDGGVYLIGISQEAFVFEKFKNLSWAQTNLFDDLLGYASSGNIACHALGCLLDLDHKTDLYTLTRHTSLTELVRYILKYLTTVTFSRPHNFQHTFAIPTLQGFQLRGPPRLFTK